MANQFLPEFITGDAVMRDATRLSVMLMDETINADDHACILAAAWFFEDLCEHLDVDPIDALAQLLDLPRPEWEPTE